MRFSIIAFASLATCLPNLFRHQAFPSTNGTFYLNGANLAVNSTAFALYFVPYANLSQATLVPSIAAYESIVGAACSQIADSVYCFGGYTIDKTATTPNGLIPASQLLWSVNLTTGNFQTLALKTEQSNFFYASIATSNSSLYVYSGDKMSFTLNVNTLVNTAVQNSTSLAPPHLESGCFLSLNNSTGIYIGGVENGLVSSEVHLFNKNSLAWSLTPTTLNASTAASPSTSAASCVVRGSNVYVFGGSSPAYSNALYVLNTTSNNWTLITANGTANINTPSPRTYSSANIVGKYIVVQGGIRSDLVIE